MPDIIISDLTCTYYNKRLKETVKALNRLSVTFLGEKINVIVGETGCGKTTLLRVIAGTLEYNSGEIYLGDIDLDTIATEDRDMAYVSQDIVLYPNKTVFDNLAFPLLAQRRRRGLTDDDIRKEVYQVAERLGVGFLLTRKPKQLSIGQQQRIAIGRALIKHPKIYLFDEPFSNLDVQTSEDLRLLVKKIVKEEKATCLFVTHNLKDALSLADQIAIIEKGELIKISTPEVIFAAEDKRIKSLFHAGEKDEEKA